GPEGQGPPPAMVRFGEVTTETLQEHQEVVGRLQAVKRSVVAAEYGGRIVAVPVEEGQRVSADGQDGAATVLAEIDDVWLKLEQQAREAELAAAKARVEEALAALEVSTRDS